MKIAIAVTILFSAALILVSTVSLVDIKSLTGITAQVISSQQEGMLKNCIQKFSIEEPSTFKISKARINTDTTDDALVSYTKGSQCGTSGCVVELCISSGQDGYVHVPFGFAAKNITAKETINNDMHDLILNNDRQTTMTWNGTAYILATD